MDVLYLVLFINFVFSLAKPRGFNLFLSLVRLIITVTFMGNKCYRIGSFKYETVCSLQVGYFIQISRVGSNQSLYMLNTIKVF